MIKQIKSNRFDQTHPSRNQNYFLYFYDATNLIIYLGKPVI
jgi:hypothetical protein